jgi:nucleotide-binding universal stress UspA family protein
MKHIIAGLSPREYEDRTQDYALSMASVFGSHVTGLIYALEPHVPSGFYGNFTADLIQRFRTDAVELANLTGGKFVKAARAVNVRHEIHTLSGTVEQATSDFVARVRTADVAILTQHHTAELGRVGDVFAEATLFQSGRPTIFVPKDHRTGFSASRILIAWDDSIHAARAVAAAMPFFAGSEIRVLTVSEPNKKQEFHGKELVRTLSMHGVNATLAQSKGEDVPETIVDEAETYRASLVVMGAYGHSRVRQFLLGGVTRLMFSRMPTPVLMVH